MESSYIYNLKKDDINDYIKNKQLLYLCIIL